MPNLKGNTPVNTFVRGLITETSPLTFPEGASIDEINFKLKRDGTRERRLGLDIEEDGAVYDMGMTAASLAESYQRAYRWRNASGTGKEIGVIQIGRFIAFLDLLTANPSAHILNGGATIDTGLANNSVWEFSTLNNYLLAVSPQLKTPYLVSYNADTDVISYETSTIQIRDLYGVDDSLTVGERPIVLTPEHKYNLRNQGWSESIVSTCGTDAIDCTFATFGVYPSNSDQWGIGRVEDLTSADVAKYDPNIAARNIVDGGQVPRGHYIIDALSRGASRTVMSGISLPVDSELTYFSTIAGYAGRAWYSGIHGGVTGGDNRNPKFSNAVFYSQIFRTPVDLVKCFQEADPTSYEFSEVVDSDGGIIHIPEASKITRLMPIKSSLFVFADNGIWEIRGDEGGFRATSFQVNKVSSIGVYSPRSIVEVNGTIFFWGVNGIFNITPSQNMVGVYDTTNISITTIQRLYDSFPDIVKKNATGFYDVNSNTARWLYTSDSANVVGDPIDIPDTPVDVLATTVGSQLNVSVDRRFPILIKINSNSAIVFYINGAANTLYWRILSIDTATLTITAGAENTLYTGTTIGNYHGVNLSDDKILFCYSTAVVGVASPRALVINFSAGVPTFGASTTLNSENNSGTSGGNMFKVGKLSSSKVVLGFKNTDNDKPSLQIIDIDVADAVTFGLVYKSATTNADHVRLSIESATKGVFGTNTSGINTTGRLIPFTIAGTIITIGTTKDISDTTMFPSSVSRQCFFADLSDVNGGTTIYGVAGSVVDSVRSHIIFPVTSSGSTVTTALPYVDTIATYTANPSATKAVLLDRGTHVIALLDLVNATRSLALKRYDTATSPPTLVSTQDMNSGVTSSPDIIYLGTNISLVGYQDNTNVALKFFAVEST